MAARAEPLLHHLKRLVGPASTIPDDDATLLQRFIAHKDEAAFAALLARHGPMVYGVCRRVLRDDPEAEDAFQAVFLLLARKAGTLRHPETLAAWLYGAARRLALMAQRGNRRRRQRERDIVAAASIASNPLDELSARELLLIVDEEMARLPERYRLPLILCGLEGRSQAEAARLLGWSSGSVKGRLERGRKQLHARLIRRGLALGASLLALESLSTATVSAALRQATVQQALTFAAGSAEGIAANVLALAESGAASMTMTKAKMGLMLLLALGLAGGTGVLAYPLRSEKQNEEKRNAAAPAPEGKIESPKSGSDKNALTDLYGDPLPSGAIARLGTVRFRHGGWMMDVLVSPDGRTLISAGGRSVDIWDAQTGRRKREIAFALAPGRFVSGIDLSPDAKLLAVANSPNKMRFWDLTSGAEVYPFGDAAPEGFRATFSPNGKLLATLEAQNRQTVTIWDIRRGKKIQTLDGGGRASTWFVRPLAFSPSGKLLAFPRDTEVCVWDVEAGKELYQLDPGTKSRMGCVVFSTDGKLLVAASHPADRGKDHAIYLWDMTTGKEVGTLKGHEERVYALAVSPKGNVLVSTSRDGTIRLWDLAKRQEIGRFPGPHRDYVALHFSADGGVLVSGENDGVLRLWDAHKHEELAASASSGETLRWVAFAPNGQTLITYANEQIGFWEPLTGRPRRIVRDKALGFAHPQVSLSPDGTKLAVIPDWKQGQALVFDVASGKPVRLFGEAGKPASVNSCVLSPDGRRLAGGGYREDIIRIWDVASGKELQQLKEQHMAQSLAFSPDGATLVSASTEANSDETVRLWNLASGKEIWRKVTRPWTAFDVKFSPDGRTLALVGGLPGRLNTTGEVRLWDAATGKELKHFEGHRERVPCVAFSPDGRMLATGSQDDTVRLWEIASGQERRCIQGHQSSISSVSFSPDGRLLVSASADTTALVWDLTDRFRDGRFQTRPLSVEEQKRCWNDLALADAARAYHSILPLIGSPKETIAFLKDHLPPVRAADPKRVAPLLAALDSDQFAQRDKAMTELEELGLATEPALHKALSAKPSLEVRRRIETILDKLAGAPRLRFLRALEVLEHIGTTEARQLLETLSQGSADLWPAQEAKKSLARLAARPAVRP